MTLTFDSKIKCPVGAAEDQKLLYLPLCKILSFFVFLIISFHKVVFILDN